LGGGKGLKTTRIFGVRWYDYHARFYDPELARFTTPDPHAENYFHASPFAYVENNPIMRIDPDGRDWYTSTDGSATMWKEGNEDIEGYSNIGATYTQDLGDGVSITYNQMEAVELTSTTNTEWVSQYSKSDWDGTPASSACSKASDAMLGGREDVGSTTITENAGNGRAGRANSNSSGAIRDMRSTIDNGTGVKVGVDFREGSSGHRDGMGDHFVVVNGYTDRLNNGQVTSTTYTYLDPGTSHRLKGAALTNHLNTGSGRLVGTHINNGRPIVVTSIRKK